jgi:DNA-binding NarL/FixJ family response regulator
MLCGEIIVTESLERIPGPSALLRDDESRIRIIVADDHAVFRDVVCGLLTMEEDFDVVGQASNGREALALLLEHRPDILLLDLHMPEQDGFATLECVKNLKCATKVIVLTASDEAAAYVRAFKLGTSGILLKESSTDLLFQGIRRVHSGEVWLDAVPAATVRGVSWGQEEDDPARVNAEPVRARHGHPLSRREHEIVAFVSRGYRNREIALKTFISEKTVKNHLHKIFAKLGVTDRLELAIFAATTALQTSDEGSGIRSRTRRSSVRH